MKQDKTFTEKLKAYMALPPDSRDIAQGAQMLLRLNHNRIMFANIIRRPDLHAGKLFYELGKYLSLRLAADTMAAVAALQQKADALIIPLLDEKKEAAHKGKRPDHDSLPDDIKALYVDNANILHQMRDLHAKLRIKSSGKYRPCDRYDDLTALLALHDRYVSNWEAYDHAAPLPASDAARPAAGATAAAAAAEEPSAPAGTMDGTAAAEEEDTAAKPKRKTRTRDGAE